MTRPLTRAEALKLYREGPDKIIEEYKARIRELNTQKDHLTNQLNRRTERIARAKAILPDVDNDIVREALWQALEGK